MVDRKWGETHQNNLWHQFQCRTPKQAHMATHAVWTELNTVRHAYLNTEPCSCVDACSVDWGSQIMHELAVSMAWTDWVWWANTYVIHEIKIGEEPHKFCVSAWDQHALQTNCWNSACPFFSACISSQQTSSSYFSINQLFVLFTAVTHCSLCQPVLNCHSAHSAENPGHKNLLSWASDLLWTRRFRCIVLCHRDPALVKTWTDDGDRWLPENLPVFTFVHSESHTATVTLLPVKQVSLSVKVGHITCSSTLSLGWCMIEVRLYKNHQSNVKPKLFSWLSKWCFFWTKRG